MDYTQATLLIAAINRLAAAHERLADTSAKSAEVATAALTKQMELLENANDELNKAT